MTRVLLVGKAAPEKGGIATFIEMLLDSSLSQTFDVRLHNLARPLGGQMGRFTSANVKRTMSDAFSVYRASRWADVVHLHTAFVPTVTIARAGLLVLAARCGLARVVVHVHGGLFPGWHTDGGNTKLVAAALRLASRVLVVSSATEQKLGEIVGPSKVQLVVNGVETERFIPRAAHTLGVPVVGFVGMLTRRKGLLDLFEASRSLVAVGKAHRVVVVGGTPTEGDVEEQTVRRAGDDHIYFEGSVPREQIHESYATFDVFCLPSWWEAAPLSVIEAMASGLPVVATNVGDVARMVDDGTTGILVPPHRPDLLADALARLLSDAELRHKMGAAGREKAFAEFDLSRTIDELARIYRDAE